MSNPPAAVKRTSVMVASVVSNTIFEPVASETPPDVAKRPADDAPEQRSVSVPPLTSTIGAGPPALCACRPPVLTFPPLDRSSVTPSLRMSVPGHSSVPPSPTLSVPSSVTVLPAPVSRTVP